jgi:hypothetical protein
MKRVVAGVADERDVGVEAGFHHFLAVEAVDLPHERQELAHVARKRQQRHRFAQAQIRSALRF